MKTFRMCIWVSMCRIAVFQFNANFIAWWADFDTAVKYLSTACYLQTLVSGRPLSLNHDNGIKKISLILIDIKPVD